MTDAFTRQGRNRLNINQKGRNPQAATFSLYVLKFLTLIALVA